MHLVELVGVHARIDDTEILHNVNLTMDNGEIYGFLGPNGAGKSTTIAVATGLIPASAGLVSVLNADPQQDDSAIHASCGVLPEQNGFYEWMAAGSYLRLFARFYGRDIDNGEIERRLSQVGLDADGMKPIASFSRGMKQRLGLARSLINNPRLLLLDEPTNGLDPRGRREIHDLLIGLSKNEGVGILLCTHLLDDVDRLCHRIGIIDKGRTLVEGKLTDLVTAKAASPRYRLRLSHAIPNAVPTNGIRVLKREGNWTIVELAASMTASQAWQDLLHQGWPISEIRRDGGGLEDYYVNLIEGAAA